MLDNRLMMIYGMLPQGVVCDIGTDHGKLPVYCVKQGKSPRALACDINEGPLSAAGALVKREGLSDKIKLVLSDGFKGIADADFDSVDTFVCAGMGGELIMSILSARFTDKYLLLSPQSAVYELTEWLLARGYDIKKRSFCKESGRIYTAMLVKHDGIVREPDLFCGVEKNDVFYEYLQKERGRLGLAAAAVAASDKADKSRLTRIDYILGEIARYENEGN